MLDQASDGVSAMRWISAGPQSRPWSVRRGDIAHSACQEGRRYRLRWQPENVPRVQAMT